MSDSSKLEARVERVSMALSAQLAAGSIPGAVVLLSDGDESRTISVGSLGLVEGDAPMHDTTIFRIASMTKPVTAAAAMILVDEGRITLQSPIAQWIPELGAPQVVRTPTSDLDDLVPAARLVTVEDLLTSRSGWGFASDFSRPSMQALFPVQRDGRQPHSFPPADRWIAELAAVPMAAQPGQAYLYDTSLAVLGVLIERVMGSRLGDFFEERLFAPLGMTDTGFTLPSADFDRFARYYARGDDGLTEADDRATWTVAPALHLGSGGLLGTAPDWQRFATMMLRRGVAPGGRILSERAVAGMLTNHITTEQRRDAGVFLDDQGWGYGGSVDLEPTLPWEHRGRFGWSGGTGTSGHLIPSTGETTILLSQVAAEAPGLLPLYREVWTAAA